MSLSINLSPVIWHDNFRFPLLYNVMFTLFIKARLGFGFSQAVQFHVICAGVQKYQNIFHPNRTFIKCPYKQTVSPLLFGRITWSDPSYVMFLCLLIWHKWHIFAYHTSHLSLGTSSTQGFLASCLIYTARMAMLIVQKSQHLRFHWGWYT